jgi:pimeloyl-ACP methyl ester carboxylesterase
VDDIGSGAREVWAFLPGEEPPSCLVIFLHGAGDPTPAQFIGWLDHLALGMSCAVIFPRYRLSASTPPATLARLRAGVSAGVAHLRRARFGFERFRAATRLRTVVAGVGVGGTLAFYYAANAKRWGLPVPAAIDSIFPTTARLPDLPLAPVPQSTRVLVQAGDEDRAAAAELREYLGSHPVSRTRFQTVRSRPGFNATQDAPLRATAPAIDAFWSRLDALIDGSP